VLVVQGRARLEILGQGELDLRPLDFVMIPAHVKHRVSWTDPQLDTIWLAVFYPPE
jgi:cupin 2 domain-containing protein